MDSASPQSNSEFQEKILKNEKQSLQHLPSQQNLHQQQGHQTAPPKNQQQIDSVLPKEVSSQKSSSKQDQRSCAVSKALKYNEQCGQTLGFMRSRYQIKGSEQEYKNQQWKQECKEGEESEGKKQGIYPDPYQDLNDGYQQQDEDEEASIRNENVEADSKQQEGMQNIYGFHDSEHNEEDQNGDGSKQYLNKHYMQNQSQMHFLQKNTDGRHLSQRQKRNFIKSLMDKIRGLEKPVAHQIISKQSDKIKVFSNQVTIWLSIYKIVFAVEFERAKNRMTQEQAVFQVESRLVDYLNQNPYEKKYKFIKISNRTFRSLKIKKCTGDYWLAAVFKKFAKKVSPLIDQAALLKKQNEKHSSLPLYNQPFSGDIMYEAAFPIKNQGSLGRLQHPRQHISLMCNNNFPHERSERYSIQYRAKIIESIDNSIERALSNIFYDKHNEYRLNLSSLKSWYISYGKLELFDEGSDNFYEQQFATHRERAKSLGNSYDNTNSNHIKTAQKEVLNYIKVNTINSRQKIRSFASNTVMRLKILELKSEKMFKNWFDRLLLNNCTDVNGSIRLKESHINIAIPNSSQPITNFKNRLFKQEAKRETLKNFQWAQQ